MNAGILESPEKGLIPFKSSRSWLYALHRINQFLNYIPNYT